MARLNFRNNALLPKRQRDNYVDFPVTDQRKVVEVHQ